MLEMSATDATFNRARHHPKPRYSYPFERSFGYVALASGFTSAWAGVAWCAVWASRWWRYRKVPRLIRPRLKPDATPFAMVGLALGALAGATWVIVDAFY